MVTGHIQGQESRRPRGVGVVGRVVTGPLDTPVEYANILILEPDTDTQVTGTITDREGRFRLDNIRPGRYDLEVRFMGFEAEKRTGVVLSADQPVQDLGSISLRQAVLLLEGVGVEGEKPVMTYEIDKKVIHVDQMQTAVSGSATEVLENVPSVTVDIEGNVSLRGSGNFQLLIDGRPTVLDAADALRQIPASAVDNIEIITNPSAKYNPDGTAGIINVVMKKDQRSGRSALFNLDAGLGDKYGGNILTENKTDRLGVVLGLDYSHFMFDGTRESQNRTTHEEITSYIHSDGTSRRGRISTGFRGGLSYNLAERDLFNLETRIGKGRFGGGSEQDFRAWTYRDPDPLFYTSLEERTRSNTFYSASLSWLHRFPARGHELATLIYLSRRDGREKNTDELLDASERIESGRRASEDGPSRDLRTKVDYTLPLGEDRFEAGYQSRFHRSRDITGLAMFDPAAGLYVDQPDFAHRTDYLSDIHSLYATYSGKLGPFGYQGGLRGEYTYRIIELPRADQTFSLDEWDYFPTGHVSYQFPRGHRQLMASYTRRISRPRGWELEPFPTWMDAYNVRIGNPALKPESIDSYELGFQTHVGKNMLSSEVYYRVNHNKVERVRSVYDADVTLHSVENVGTDYALGCELMLNMDVMKGWNMNLMGNLYEYRIEGVLYDKPFSRGSFNWTTRLNNVFRLGPSTQIQVNGRYNSPTVSAQGRREGFMTADAAVKQEFFDKSLTLTLQVRDVFRTGKFEFSSEGPDFSSSSRFTREAPQVMLNIRYAFNRQNRERNNRQNGDTEEGRGDFPADFE